MAVDADGNEIEDIDGDDDPNKVTETEAQRIKSWLGRVEKMSKDNGQSLKTITEQLEAMGQQSKPQFGEDPEGQLNKKLQEMILDGNVTGALNLVNQINKDAERLQKQHTTKGVTSALDAIAEDPMMKNEELASKVKEMANKLVGEGHDPKAAVSFAKTTVENAALKQMVQSGATGKGALEMLGAGSGEKSPATTENKFPSQFEESYQKGKAKGLFKDRKDYTDNLSPAVREQYGV